MHKKCGSFGIFWDILGYFGIFYPETKRNDFYISGTRKETTFLKRGYFRITEKRKETTVIFRVPEKKRLFLERGYFKKRKRKRERKVVSTISAYMSRKGFKVKRV